MPYLISSYDPLVVLASIGVATFASYVALDLAKRVRAHDRRIARAWWLAGSVALGTGIWAMHFVGMLAFTLPIALGYGKLLTFASWGAAVGVSAIALYTAGQGQLTTWRLLLGSLAMGGGICAMHYIGMAAMAVTPGIVWSLPLVAASAAIAWGASAAALLIFFWLRRPGQRGVGYQLLAAAVMGAAISGMHYTGMAAADFVDGSVCLTTDSLRGDSLGGLVLVATLLILSLTLATSLLDARMQGRTARLADSLKQSNEELRLANVELHRRAFLDPLTGLPNRLLFEDRLQHASTRCDLGRQNGDRRREQLAVLFVDLDGFKPVNDSFGHAAGDVVLREVARRIEAVAGPTGTAARIGGDEFVLLIEGVQSATDALAAASRVVQALRQPVDLPGRQVRIGASVGVSLYPEHGQADKLLTHADAAMYVAKQAGGGRHALFESHMGGDALNQLNLQTDLAHAIERGELELHYQPKIDGGSGMIRGVEALLRWNHPTRGRVGPDVFIPLAERFGMITQLGNWVIDEACRQMREWADNGVRMRVAVNVSLYQLREADLVSRVEQALARNQLEASQLLCEITESVAMGDVEASQRTFAGLAGIGVFLSIDDFGTGYSSLSYLRQLPARQLKIDRSFVADLATSRDAYAIVDSIIHLAHALGLRVVAEGVETPAQRDILIALGCDELQGYHYARPMPATDLFDWAVGRGPQTSAEFSPSVLMTL